MREELFDQVPVSISVIDRDYRIVEANFSFGEVYGDWEGRRCHEVYKGRNTKCFNCGAAATFEDGQIHKREEIGKSHNGRPSYYIVQLIPLIRPDGSIPYVIEMSTDITHVKDLEREKLEAERLAVVGQTVAGLAHGIKNIIMGLEGGMYVVRSGLTKNNEERVLRGWQMLENDIDRISSFAKEFLEFARGRTPEVAIVDPNEIVRQVINLYSEKAKQEGVALLTELDPEIEPAPMDADGIHTSLTNLVLNAIDACLMSTGERHTVLVTSREREGVLIFEVADSGCGMDYDIKRKVFTSFFSTKAAGKGTGLGLLTTRKIVQEHGGKVSFESTEGEGSVFRLEFPRKRLPRLSSSEETE